VTYVGFVMLDFGREFSFVGVDCGYRVLLVFCLVRLLLMVLVSGRAR